MVNLKKGTEIYYSGDMANKGGFGVVTKRYWDKYGNHVDIKMDDGREFKQIYVSAFSREYLGHGGTRFVTKEAYLKQREEQAKKLHYSMMGKKTAEKKKEEEKAKIKCPCCKKVIECATYEETTHGHAVLEGVNRDGRFLVKEWEEDTSHKELIFYCPYCAEDITSEIQAI